MQSVLASDSAYKSSHHDGASGTGASQDLPRNCDCRLKTSVSLTLARVGRLEFYFTHMANDLISHAYIIKTQ
jgi:hypothetical protein